MVMASFLLLVPHTKPSMSRLQIVGIQDFWFDESDM